MVKKLVPLFIVLALIVIVRNLIVSILNLSNNSKRVDDLNKQLEAQKKENNFLAQKLFFVKSNEFIEKEAREKLGLIKIGEYIVLAPEPQTKKPEETKAEDPNWKKWWNLFF